MRSIRLSLIGYFLGLLLLALGVASLLVYQSARTTLDDKEEATANLIKARFAQRQAEEQKQLDDQLLDQAFSLAGRLKVDWDWGRMNNRSLHLLGAASALNTPMGHLAAAPWLLQGQLPRTFASPFAYEIWRGTLVQIKLAQNEVELPPGRDRLLHYYQVDTNQWGPPLRSSSLAGLSFPQADSFGGAKTIHWEADSLELSPGRWVRRLRVKVANTRLRFTRPARPPGGFGPPARRYEPPPLFLTLHVAADLSRLHAKLDGLAGQRDDELANIAADTATALSRLRGRLLGIGLLTFAATVVGTCWLVWLGLLPLKRLSAAVEKVSTRDFHLTIESGKMPAELQPVTEKLAGTLDLLGKAFAREKQATADISHELRTPLAALMTTCELALRRERTAEKYREMFADCHASAKYLHQIVERLLTLARLDSGVDRCRAQQVDVAQLAEQCAAIIRPLAEAQGLTLNVRPADSEAAPARADTDPDKLREIVANLLHNAIQYNRPAGRIDLSVSRENGHVRLEVADTGIGIAPEAKDRIFERFFRADPSRNTDGMHAGLGLAIVKEYIGVMGGSIEVDSRPGEGTVFRVELPACA